MNENKQGVEPWMEAAIKEIQETWIDPPLMPSTEAWDDKEIVLFPSAIIARHAAPVLDAKDAEIARLKSEVERLRAGRWWYVRYGNYHPEEIVSAPYLTKAEAQERCDQLNDEHDGHYEITMHMLGGQL